MLLLMTPDPGLGEGYNVSGTTLCISPARKPCVACTTCIGIFLPWTMAKLSNDVGTSWLFFDVCLPDALLPYTPYDSLMGQSQRIPRTWQMP